MKKAKTKSQVTKKKCLDCSSSLFKLKELFDKKGVVPKFGKIFKACKKHNKDNILIIYNSYKFDKLPTATLRSLKYVIRSAYKQIQNAKLRKRRMKLKELSHIDEFTVEDVPFGEINKSTKPLEVGGATSAANLVDDDDDDKDSSTTEIVIQNSVADPPIPKNQNNCIPAEEDSLGLLNFTEDFQHSQNLERVKFWQQYGHPFVKDLPASQYDIPDLKDTCHDLGWNSPGLSPIY